MTEEREDQAQASAAEPAKSEVDALADKVVAAVDSYIARQLSPMRGELAMAEEQIKTLRLRADRQKNHLDALQTKVARLLAEK